MGKAVDMVTRRRHRDGDIPGSTSQAEEKFFHDVGSMDTGQSSQPQRRVFSWMRRAQLDGVSPDWHLQSALEATASVVLKKLAQALLVGRKI